MELVKRSATQTRGEDVEVKEEELQNEEGEEENHLRDFKGLRSSIEMMTPRVDPRKVSC